VSGIAASMALRHCDAIRSVQHATRRRWSDGTLSDGSVDSTRHGEDGGDRDDVAEVLYSEATAAVHLEALRGWRPLGVAFVEGGARGWVLGVKKCNALIFVKEIKL
jgi:hypothetical protein